MPQALVLCDTGHFPDVFWSIEYALHLNRKLVYKERVPYLALCAM